MKTLLNFFKEHNLIAALAFLCTTVLMTFYGMANFEQELSKKMATQYAEQFITTIRSVQSYYSDKVVSKARQQGISVVHDYQNKEGAIPLPATFTVELSEKITEEIDNVSVRLYSEFPFPLRKKNNSIDAYEKKALDFFRKSPNEAFISFEDYKGVPSLRYSAASIMEESCVACHNDHPDSPKINWKVGDVRGVQQITIPMGIFEDPAGDKSLIIFLIMIGIMVPGVIILIVILRELKRVNFTLKKTNASYRRFVPQKFLSYLNKKNITDVELGDSTKKKMSVIFTDMRSFTSISEKMSPEENFKFLNEYFGAIEPIIERNSGFVDKFIGDAVMALFDGKSDNALRASIEILKALHEHNITRKMQGDSYLKTGIGINSGDLMLGVVGGKTRMDGTVISDAVNLASRIESLNKIYGTSLLISDETQKNLEKPEDFLMRMIDEVKLKGKEQRVIVWEVFSGDSERVKNLKQETLEEFVLALQQYSHNQYEAAQVLFSKVLKRNSLDTVSALYLQRCIQKIKNLH